MFGLDFPPELIQLIIMADCNDINIVCGHYNTAIITDKIYVCGENSDIDIYTKSFIDFSTTIIKEKIRDIVFGINHIIVLTDVPNKIWTWGCNRFININTTIPQPIIMESAIKSVDCFNFHNAALMENGDLYMWGKNNSGQLGLGDLENVSSPTKNSLSNVIEVSCSGDFTMAITSNHELWSWGCNFRGKLGLGNTDDRYLPTRIGLSNIISVNCGDAHAAALTKEHMYVWGSNWYGKLGLGNTTREKHSPQKLELLNVISVKCGMKHTMALTRTGNLFIWGDNIDMFPGLDPICNQFSSIGWSFTKPIKCIACKDCHGVIVTSDNEIYVWGNNYRGQLGLGDTREVRLPQKLDFQF